MTVTRYASESTHTDIIYQNEDYQKIEKPDYEAKEYSMSTIYNPSSNEESFIEISGFLLDNNHTVSFYNIDQYHFYLQNGNDVEKSYKLRVRYLGEDNIFHVRYIDIHIDSNTRHVMLLQPTDETNKVIILIDRYIDGTIDDTLNIMPANIYEIDNWNSAVSMYQNPSSESFHVKMAKV